MQPFLTARREEIAELCRKHHVRRLAVFGSAARDDFDPERSDVDVLVEFDEIPVERYFDNKTSLLNGLRSEFAREVDLLTWKSIRNPVLRKELESSQQELYAA
jgi:predicted nucleotidyltransferase